MFQIFMFQSVLNISEHVEICNACWKHIEKECWKISACSENCKKACWKFQHVLKTVAHVEKVCLNFQCMLKTVMDVQNCNACSKLCWIFQGVLKTCWKFQGMLKTVICVENYVEIARWKFQHVLKTVTHVESYVKISRCVENVYVRHVENHIENHVEVQKKHHHIIQHMLKFSGRFHFSSSILHTFAMWDILNSSYFITKHIYKSKT